MNPITNQARKNNHGSAYPGISHQKYPLRLLTPSTPTPLYSLGLILSQCALKSEIALLARKVATQVDKATIAPTTQMTHTIAVALDLPHAKANAANNSP